MLENKNFVDAYKELYPDYPNENYSLSQTERDAIRMEAYEEFIKFRASKLGA